MTEPEQRSRPATAAETPSLAQLLVRRARAADWKVVTTYARGTWKVGDRGKPKVIDSIVVRMSRGDDRAVAVWHDRRFASGVLWGTTRPMHMLGLNELTKEIAS